MLSTRAEKKWDQLDEVPPDTSMPKSCIILNRATHHPSQDGSGVLEAREVNALALWVWQSFHPGQTITGPELAVEVAEDPKLLLLEVSNPKIYLV